MQNPEADGRARHWMSHGMVLMAGVAACLFFSRRAEVPDPVLPQDRALIPSGWADESRCIECHYQAETFSATGHARTLSPAGDPESLELLKRFDNRSGNLAEGVDIEFEGDRILAVYSRDGRQSRIELEWCFGSGQHARTWVGTDTGSWGATDLVEFRWTWFDALDGFEITPGQPRDVPDGYFGGLGLLYDHPKTRRCFGCHSTRMTLEQGRLVEQELHAGVTCQSCHGPRGRHVETAGAVREHIWNTMDQEESVSRCAQCHRRTEEMDSNEIHPENKNLARFQPIGLTQSRCFQSSEMTCLSCHDPHIPLNDQNLTGIWQCVQCHDGGRQQTTCGAGFQVDCLSCHMPKVRGNSPLEFTDHWIRVRSDAPQEPGDLKSDPKP